MVVPETSVDEYHRPTLRKDQIRRTWKSAVVHAVAVPETMQGMSKQQFRLGIALAHCCHQSRSGSRIQTVHDALNPNDCFAIDQCL